jgi:ketosteroid isomerase-like protein
MRRLPWVPIVLAAMLAPSVSWAQPQSADARVVLALDSLWARNYATHDTTAAARLMADDFYMTSANGTAKDKATEMGDIRPYSGLRMEYFRTEQPRVRVYGATAVVSGHAAWAYEMNGRTATNRRRYVAVYTRGGPLGWQLAELHMALVPPAGGR